MSGGSAKKEPPTAQEKALAEVGAEKFNDYVDNGLPRAVETREAIRATGAKLSDAAMVTSAGVEQAGADQRATFRRVTGGGSDGFTRGDYDAAMAASKAEALTGAREGTQDLETQGEQKLAAFGRKLSDDTQLSLSQSGRRATQAAVNDATRRFEAGQSKLAAAATIAGAGIGAYGQYRGRQRQDKQLAALAKSMRGSE